MIGKTVSHYRILGSLGAGGMGVVYSGEDVRLGRPVALKFVPEEMARDAQAIERLQSEARTASGLNHTNICTIYDIGEYEGQPFIVMELLKGQTLRERLTAGPLKIHDAVELGIHVADALDAAHQRAIIHRDIKPANLFLVDRGPVKILDFGLAKLLSRQPDGSTTQVLTRDRTSEGITLGTVSYMSPEQVTGEELDGRSDLFSLGVVLYEALTGHQPFTGKTTAVVFSSILTRAPIAPVVFNPEMPLRLQEVINNSLEKDRELRYQDAAGFRADLKRIKRDLESGHSGIFRLTGATALATGDRTGSAQSPVGTPGSGSSPALPATASTAATIAKSKGGVAAATAIVVAALSAAAFWGWSRLSTPPPPVVSNSPSATLRTRIALATTSLESKDYRAALAYAEEALRIAPEDASAFRIREAARSLLARFDAAVAQAGERLAAGDLNGASSAVNAARAIDPAAPVVTELSAQIAEQVRALPGARREPPAPASKFAPAPPVDAARQAANSPAVRGADRSRPGAPPPPAPAASRPAPSASPGSPASPIAAPDPAPPPTQAPAAPPVAPPPVRPAPAPETTAPSNSPAPAAPPIVRPAPAPETSAPPNPPSPPRPSPSEGRDGPAPSARSAETDDAAIRRVVAAYARAIETKDLALFRSVKPNMSADEQRRVEDGFRAVASQKVTVTIVSIELRGQDATVHLKRRDTILAGGRQQTSEGLQTMTLTRAASAWVIREIGR